MRLSPRKIVRRSMATGTPMAPVIIVRLETGRDVSEYASALVATRPDCPAQRTQRSGRLARSLCRKLAQRSRAPGQFVRTSESQSAASDRAAMTSSAMKTSIAAILMARRPARIWPGRGTSSVADEAARVFGLAARFVQSARPQVG